MFAIFSNVYTDITRTLRESCGPGLLPTSIVICLMIQAWNWFFHARAGPKACIIAGWARIGYAFLILADKALLTVDFRWFFLSGRMPYEAMAKDPELEGLFTILSFAPESPLLFWSIHILTMVCAALLLLGIMPRLQVVLLHGCLLTFHHHNAIIWDGEDVMFLVWNALFLFLPLHRVTIYEWMGNLKPEEKDASWPMWPFRLWQIEICYIYLGAGFGKLASERWQDGEAMYHIIHITDFFGGLFTPEVIFNRIGPLQIMTYSSMTLECVCSFFIWPLETRMVTFWVILSLHIGIELSMNMHCFEWLAMLGWLFFLVEPAKEIPYKPSYLLSIVLTLTLIVAGFDTIPFDEFIYVTPKFTERTLENAKEIRALVRELVVTPYLMPIGLAQSVWNMFCAAPDEVYVYEAQIGYRNGTRATWGRPKWDDMDWLSKKRWQRPMTFYDSIAAGYEWPVMESLVRGIAVDNGPDVVSVVLKVHTYQPPEHPPAHLGFWDIAKQPRERTNTKRLFSLNICDDMDSKCGEWTQNGFCQDDEHWFVMMDTCRKSCGFCHDTSDIRLGQRLAVLWPKDDSFYSATVVEIENDRRYRVEYDDYEFEYERYEWIDRIDMRRRKFILLTEEEQSQNQLDEDLIPWPIKLDVRVETIKRLPFEPMYRHHTFGTKEKAMEQEL